MSVRRRGRVVTVEFDREHDVATVNLTRHVPPGAIVEDLEVPLGGIPCELHLGRDAAGRILTLEVVGASTLLPEDLLDMPSRDL